MARLTADKIQRRMGSTDLLPSYLVVQSFPVVPVVFGSTACNGPCFRPLMSFWVPQVISGPVLG